MSEQERNALQKWLYRVIFGTDTPAGKWFDLTLIGAILLSVTVIIADSIQPYHERYGDLFKSIAAGKASVVTDQIATFNERGIELASGDQLDADIIVTATGFNLNVLGDIAFTIDGEPLQFHESITYRGAMFTGIPNMAWVFGYFRASWTLRADMVADFVCRLLHHMDDLGASTVTPTLRESDAGMNVSAWVDPENFNPGYLMRGLHLLPQQGDLEPWKHKQDYWTEKDELPAADLDDGTLTFK